MIMPAKATRVTEAELASQRREESGTGLSLMFVPDSTFRQLSDAAAARNMTVPQLIGVALSAYLAPEAKAEAAEEKPPRERKAPTLKGYK
jgi:hypothetical protein